MQADFTKFNFDGYVVGQRFENKGYQGHALEGYGYKGERASDFVAELNEVLTFTVLTLPDGTIAGIRKTYSAQLKTLVSDISEKFGLEFERRGGVYRAHEGDLYVEISKGNPSRYIWEIEDYGGVMVLGVYSEQKMKKYEEEETQAKQRVEKRKRQASAQAFTL